MDTNPRRVQLSLAQVRALVDHVRHGTTPPDMDRRTQGALQRAADRLHAELTRKPVPQFTVTLCDLEEALCNVRRQPFVELVHRRVRDLLAVARLWVAAEDLPVDDRSRLLDVALVDSLSWAGDVLDACESAGIQIEGMGPKAGGQ